MRLFIVGLTFLSWLIASPAYAGDKYYLNSIQGLTLEPEGDTVGQLYQGVEVEKIAEEGNWAKVRLVGWLKITGLSPQPPQALEVRNLIDRFSKHDDYVHVLGEVKNNSPQDYKLLMVTVVFYNQDREVVNTTITLIPSLKKGEVKSFKAIVEADETIKTYKAQVEPLN